MQKTTNNKKREKKGSRPCRVMKTRTVLTRCTTTLSKSTKRHPSSIYHINLETRRNHSGRQEIGQEEALYKKFSSVPGKRYVLKHQKLKMSRRTLTELAPKNRRKTLKVRYKKLNVFTSPTIQV